MRFARDWRGGIRSFAAIALGMLFPVVVVALAVSYAPHDAHAAHVTPVFIEGNPDCSDSGVDEAFKVDPVADGTFPVPGGSITIVVNNSAKTFDWTSTVSIGQIIVKGGPNANLYLYVPASFGDTSLHSPTNPMNDRFYGLSHISFCDPGVIVTPTPTDTPPPPDTPTPTNTPPPPDTPTPTDTPPPPDTPTPTDTPPPSVTETPPSETPDPTDTPFSEVLATVVGPTVTSEAQDFPPTGTGGGRSSASSYSFFIALAGLGVGLLALGFWRYRLQR